MTAERSPGPRWSRVIQAVSLSSLLDGVYNPEGQQRLGVIRILLQMAPPTAPGRRAALPVLAIRPINTSVVLSGLALGPLISSVASADATSSEGEAQARHACSTLGPAVGAVGDRFRFGALEPAASGGFLLGALIWPPLSALWYLVGYLGVQWCWRWRGWATGLQSEAAVRALLGGRVLERWIDRLGRLARILLGASLGFVAVRTVLLGGAEAGIAFAGLVALGVWLSGRTRVSPWALGWCAWAAALMLGHGIEWR